MKRFYIFLSFVLVIPAFSFAQKSMYLTGGGELLFQFSKTEQDAEPLNDIMRFTVFLNYGSYFHYDFSSKVGLYTGLAVRNIGYIHQEVNEESNIVKIKRRSYTLGVPLSVKFGNMNRTFFFFGGEYEWLFTYKEKQFVGNVKSRYVDWFSNRTPHFLPSLFAGIEFPLGFNVKVKYYLKNFMNKDYRDTDGTYPYAGQDVRIIYVSLSMNIYRWHLGPSGGSAKTMEFFTRW